MGTHPEIKWAQRSSEHNAEKNVLFVTLSVSDIDPSYSLTITDDKLTFEGQSKSAKQQYSCTLDFFAAVEPETNKKVIVTGKGIALTLQKKEAKEEYWPRLTKTKAVPFIKTDFDKWRDEDEQEDEVPSVSEDNSGMPPGMMGGMPGMGGAGGMDMESLMASMKGMQGGAGGMPDFSSFGGGEDEEDSDDEPAEASKDKGKGKAQEADDEEDMPPLVDKE